MAKSRTPVVHVADALNDAGQLERIGREVFRPITDEQAATVDLEQLAALGLTVALVDGVHRLASIETVSLGLAHHYYEAA